MNVRLSVTAAAKATRISGDQPPLDIRIRLDIEDAVRGDPVIGSIEKAFAGANSAVAKVLETRRY